MMERCVLCDNTQMFDIMHGCQDYEYGVCYKAILIKCKKCSLHFVSPRPKLQELYYFYPRDYANYSYPKNVITKLLFYLYEKRNKKEILSLIGNSGRILDVGCADGNYLDFLRKDGKEGWELYGTDISESAAKKAIEKGYKVYIGELEDLEIPNGYFDLVRMNHVIEHVINPKSTLEKVFKILKQRGLSIVETPNTSCPDFFIFRKYWGALHFPRHIHLFSPRTLTVMAKKCGFRVTKTKHTIMPTGWSLGIQNYLCNRFELKITNGRIRMYPFLLILFIPILIAQKLVKHSTMVRFVIEKDV